MTVPDLGEGRPQRRNRIVSPRQVLVEGNDDAAVFRALVRHQGMSDLQVQPYNGKDNLRDFLETLVADSYFASVTSLAVVADADDNRQSAEDRIRGALYNSGLPASDAPLRMSWKALRAQDG